MTHKLVIAEKPSVARSIAGVIGATEKHAGYLEGNGYVVSWCIGHLVSFADAGRYDERFKKWRYEDSQAPAIYPQAACRQQTGHQPEKGGGQNQEK